MHKINTKFFLSIHTINMFGNKMKLYAKINPQYSVNYLGFFAVVSNGIMNSAKY